MEVQTLKNENSKPYKNQKQVKSRYTDKDHIKFKIELTLRDYWQITFVMLSGFCMSIK